MACWLKVKSGLLIAYSSQLGKFYLMQRNLVSKWFLKKLAQMFNEQFNSSSINCSELMWIDRSQLEDNNFLYIKISLSYTLYFNFGQEHSSKKPPLIGRKFLVDHCAGFVRRLKESLWWTYGGWIRGWEPFWGTS
jgi:hypothetical protein